MVKLSFFLLSASASCSTVSARFFHPNRRMGDVGEEDRRLIDVGAFVSYDPPISLTNYNSDTCSDSAETIISKIASLRVLSEGEFCIGGMVAGAQTMSYDLMDEITCTPWGIYDRYSTCTDATCSDCTPSSVSYYTYDEFLVESLDGFCFKSSFSFDPTTFTNLQTTSFEFTEDADMDTADQYLDSIAKNSCIADALSEVGGETSDETSKEESSCQTITDLICDKEDFGVMCEFLKSGILDGESYTLFAPKDEAFSDVGKMLETLDDDDASKVFLFHATKLTLKAKDLNCSTLIVMVDGGLSRTICKDGDFIQKGGGNRKNNLLPVITETDMMACNGVVHVVSEVMLPNFIDEF
mmetsp:Transcript_25259/g.59116  ORF Transcript_25259/g.59116 Transcript_25259/m.59116 type:complete len:354 (-) Transcript_25259:168-1229(-)|eukprot:CAMPEP_0197185672 /NCGR_PEP_ID=MMETSP1423-20130617/12403_1 /TAXON_ID=476441 /ORGANISM="Pseudo-nitzschia heimii, Strain UNC1101" /LENGTH=353 /DNA_ID=CAMNT_0042636799 /DNA_START=21 /DNA_END=1082 /DNA_ORIENTATION=+